MDIRQGDILVLNPGKSNEASYPIRSVADWTHPGANSAAFFRLASVDANTKRGVASGGKTGSPTLNLEGLKSTAPIPVTPELAQAAGLASAHEAHQVFIADAEGFVHLVISETKRSS